MTTPGEESYEGDPYDYDEDVAQRPVPDDEWDEYVPGVAEAETRRRQPRTYAALETAAEHRGKVLHDKPPIWDGEQAEKLLKPYLKELSLWLKTTDTPKRDKAWQ